MVSRQAVAVPLGAALGLLTWILFSGALGYSQGQGFVSPAVESLILAALGGVIGWTLSSLWSGVPWWHGRVAGSRPLASALAPLMLGLGVGASALGVAFAFMCAEGDCRVHPYRDVGVLVVVLGSIVFLIGIVLTATSRADRQTGQ